MLVDEQNRNVFPLLCELVEGALDGRGLGFRVDDQVVLLRVWRLGHVLCCSWISPVLLSLKLLYISSRHFFVRRGGRSVNIHQLRRAEYRSRNPNCAY